MINRVTVGAGIEELSPRQDPVLRKVRYQPVNASSFTLPG